MDDSDDSYSYNDDREALKFIVIPETPPDCSREPSPVVEREYTISSLKSVEASEGEDFQTNLCPADSKPPQHAESQPQVYTMRTSISYTEEFSIPSVPISSELRLQMLANRAQAEVGFKRIRVAMDKHYGLDEKYMEDEKELYEEATKEAEKSWDEKEAEEKTYRSGSKKPPTQDQNVGDCGTQS
ncbi:hypothetical protein PGT21_026424 [Puccinia graminis f. sp. tritici]|uniref:Uncharacterized protein n=1 Tax=Puccinia graminis f. sp. tritici TaxID=56615 RepID=A0A5B0MI85_PUCGR|nr:hypothetical protein PGTUg99_006930 [Puccinia graminis f. sp. tritici]KAA1091125.1 hypothetical protein PGT21_026424 [Puccinia graminis f. sp. tritici]